MEIRPGFFHRAGGYVTVHGTANWSGIRCGTLSRRLENPGRKTKKPQKLLRFFESTRLSAILGNHT